MPILQKGPKLAKKFKLATAAPFDTLDTIAKKNAVKDGWQTVAYYLFGSIDPDVVNRAMIETIGTAKVDLLSPEKTQLKPMAGHSGEVPLPEEWTDNTFESTKRYRLTILRAKSPTAISITNLDKWFIPGKETADIRYTTEGDLACANLVDFSIYGSNYCECTDWAKGLGTYKILEGEQLFKQEGMKIGEHSNRLLEVKGSDGKSAGWKGEANPAKGILSLKQNGAQRFINVAFSPYTVHFRYRKSVDDQKATLLLEPFWPQFEETKSEPAVTAGWAATPATFQFTNADLQDYGALEITDAAGQRVHHVVLTTEQLAKGSQNLTWDKNYLEGVLNGKFDTKYLDDSAEPTPLKQLLFKSTPYVAKVTTFKRKAKADSLKLKWEIKDTTRLERGMVIVTDKDGVVVFQSALAKDKVGQGKQELAWDGKYIPGLKNSRGKKTDPADTVYEAIPEDMPYRLQVQAHTGENQLEGLALAAMHTEVRLYVHKDDYRPADVRYNPVEAKPSAALAFGKLIPGDAPDVGKKALWFRYKLAEHGFHPGPISDAAVADADAVTEYKIALKEFKRSVPADPAAAVGSFARQSLKPTDIETESAQAQTALTNLRDDNVVKYKREWFGDPDKVLANSDDPDLTGDALLAKLRDPKKEVITWVDERQYYTTPRSSKDETNKDFLAAAPAGSDEGQNMGLNDYRGPMANGDTRTTTDSEGVSRPWIPLQTELRLLSQREGLDVKFNETTVFSPMDSMRDAMRQAIGPLRVDWTFDELSPDVSTISPGNYDNTKLRARKYVAWAMRANAAAHTRKDTARAVSYTNCPENLGGIRPTASASYYKSAFGSKALSLEPWVSTPVDTTESVATVVHDHIATGQVDKTTLHSPLVGLAGAFFHPSRIAGDGYRVRAEVRFEKFDGYEFPNLEALKARYPQAPQTHSSRIRNWRRSSFRGYLCWSAATGHWPAFIDRFRNQFRPAHIYFVHEGGAARTFQVSDVFDPATPAHVTRYKAIVKNNLKDATLTSSDAYMTLKSGFVWPFSERDNFGWPYRSKLDMADGDVWQEFLQDACLENTWGFYSEALLFAILKEIEKKGVMRGHLFAEFLSSTRVEVRKYECNRDPGRGPSHSYWMMEKPGSAQAVADGTSDCPSPSCYSTASGINPRQKSKMYSSATNGWDELPMWAEGNALGATWLFTVSDADTWVHEVGHHRHFEHAATAPGGQYSAGPSGVNGLHDSEPNELTWPAPHAHTGDERWDRDCIMSYTTGEPLHFCGKCLLRNRGWKVQSLAMPGTQVREPV